MTGGFRLPGRLSNSKATESVGQKRGCNSCWQTGRMRGLRAKALATSLMLLILNLSVTPAFGAEKVYSINLSATTVAESLTQLSEQTGVQVLFSYDIVEGKKAQPLKGAYTFHELLELLLLDTGLSGSLSNKGVLMIAAEQSVKNDKKRKEAMNNKRSALAAALMSIFGVSEVTSAQPSTPVTRGIEEVIVTAQKRAENLQDVPVAISVFSGDNLISFGADNAQALQNLTPGLVFNNSSAISQPYLRGVGTRFANNGLEASIATYVDDRYIARSTATAFNFVDIERVEVLKGPQGVLFGRNAAGGAIRVITKDVTDDLEGNLTGSVGNYGYYSLSGILNLPVSDTFGARFSAVTRQRDGFADNLSPIGLSELDDEDFQAFRGKFRWDMSERIAANLSLSYWQRNDAGGNETIDRSAPALNTGISRGGISGESLDKVATIINEKDDGDEFSAQLRFDVDFQKFDFVSISTYSDYEMKFASDGDGTSAPVFDSYIDENEEAYSQEFQLISNNESNWDWLMGTYFYKSDADYELQLDVGLPSRVSPGFQNMQTTALAVFGQTTWHRDDRWSLTIGGRWSYEEKKATTLASPTAITIVGGIPFRDKHDWSEFTPKATIEYKLDNSLVYFTFSRGFKSGGYNYSAPANTVLEPEILDMYEIGFKGDFVDQKMRLNASAYYYDYSDLQVSRAAIDAGTTVTQNASNSTVMGLDVDLIWLATENLTITAGLNILDSEYKDYPDATAKVFNAALTGNPLAAGMLDVPFDANGHSLLRAPDWSAFLSIAYDFHVGKATLPAVISYSYKDDYDFDFIAHPLSMGMRQKGYGLINARVSLIFPGVNWELSVWGNNITDEEYFDDLVGNSAGIRGSYGVPRTFGLDVSFNW